MLYRTLTSRSTLLCAALAWCLAACATLREDYPRQPSSVLPAAEQTRLGKAVGAQAARHARQSGFYLLDGNLDALTVRSGLIDVAERTIDVQYYYIRDDLTGSYLLARLLTAAERGVRVRVLIDDVHTTGKDLDWAALSAHRNIEVRLFNPFRGRGPGISRLFEFAADGKRLTRRMHNKTFIVDNSVAIVGGRNLGDDYFENRGDLVFHDLDVLAAGPLANEVSRSFDRYWNDEYAVPIEASSAANAGPRDVTGMQVWLRAAEEATLESDYGPELRKAAFTQQLLHGKADLVWAPARVLDDRPDKIEADQEEHTSAYLAHRLQPLIEATRGEIIVVSPYLIPGDAGLEFFRSLRKRDVALRILTNSLSSTDVSAVHAAYAGYRRDLLEMGVELYELRATAQRLDRKRRNLVPGSSQASLHAKVFVFDRRAVFIGTLNLDPRSLLLNTEIGILIDSDKLTEQVLRMFERAITPGNSYRLVLEPSSTGGKAAAKLVWLAQDGDQPLRYTAEPEVGFWRRFSTGVMSLLPLDSQL